MRISATTLESFRLFMDPEQEWMSEADMLATIGGRFEQTRAIELGQAFGKVLEEPGRFQVPGGYQYCARFDDWQFSEATMAPAFALVDRRGVFEAKATKQYGAATVVAKADHMLGAHLSEFKTTCSTFNFDKYAESCQWRFMADIFQPLKVTYHVFLLDDHENGVVELKGVESFDLYPYAGLSDDCAELVQRFTSYVEAHGFGDMLRQRQRVAEAA